MIRAVLLAALIASPAVAQAPERVVALGGAVTEIAFALGQGGRLAARDTTSSYPPEAQALPDVGYVRALSPEGVLSARPDMILAEEGAGPPETIAALAAAGIPFHEIPAGEDPETLDAKIRAVAEALDAADAATPVLAALHADLDRLAEARQAVARPRRVMFVLSVQGGRIMAAGAGSGAEAMIRLAGAENAMTGFDGYKPVSDEAVTRAAPEVIVMMNRGEASADHGAPDDELLAMPALATTPAARDRAVIRMDGLYLLGFGPRTGQAALELHRAIYGAG